MIDATPEQLHATIAFLTEDRDQHRVAAETWMRRYEAAEAREREARDALQRMREERGDLVLRWTELGQALLTAARAWRETGDGAALLEALLPIDEEERANAPRYPNRRRLG